MSGFHFLSEAFWELLRLNLFISFFFFLNEMKRKKDEILIILSFYSALVFNHFLIDQTF